MKFLIILLLGLTFFNTNLAAQQTDSVNFEPFGLHFFYEENLALDAETEKIFDQLNDRQRAGQMIVAAVGRYGKPEADVLKSIQNQSLGGVLLLNGSKDEFIRMVNRFDDTVAAGGGIPLLYSADAEPSLINRKISGLPKVKKTNQITDSKDCRAVTKQINQMLNEIGIRHNYAPVSDISPNNEAIGNRSFGNNLDSVIAFSDAFIKTSAEDGIVATAKHFPGHGFVKGDTHSKLVYINGEMKELPVFKALIDSGALSMMVAHIAVRNNEKYTTAGMPATCSRKLVTDLLKTEMGFKGIVITDAMNMGAVAGIKDAEITAVKAGCDIILMPKDENKLADLIVQEMSLDNDFREQIYTSAKKIIRLKLCLGLFD